MSKELDLADFVITPKGGAATKLQNVAQDLYDMQELELELSELREKIDDQTGEQAFNLDVELDTVQLSRGCLSRALCLLVEWAPKVGESTKVKIDDTKKKFVTEVPLDEDVTITTVPTKGNN